MILRILKSNKPVNYIIFPIIGLCLWFKSILNPTFYSFFESENQNVLYKPLNALVQNSALGQTIVAFFLLLIIALIIQQINSRYTFMRTRTMLPAPVYVLIASGFTAMQTLHPVYFAAVFMLFSMNRLFSTFDQAKPYSAAFDVGLLLGISSLFYFGMLLLLPAFLLGIAILSRDFRWREFTICIIGFVLPFVFALGTGILTEQFLEMLNTFSENIISPNNHFRSNVPLHIFLGSLILLTGLGSFRILQQYDTKKVSNRKYFSVFFLIFVCSLAGFIFVPAISQEILLITAIPVTFLTSNLLVFMKSKFWGELIFTLLLAMVIYMQFVVL